MIWGAYDLGNPSEETRDGSHDSPGTKAPSPVRCRKLEPSLQAHGLDWLTIPTFWGI